MFAGPVFTREVVTAARRKRLFVLRAAYPAGLLLLLATAWLVYTGPRVVRGAGDVARFGQLAFEILAAVQLALATFFSALFTAGAVAQEKDRGTLELLLMTRLSNRELVLGKLLSSLLHLTVMYLAALPLFMLIPLLGGVSFAQVARVYFVTAAAICLAGSLGSTVALWRDKTFQTLATTALALLVWTGLWDLASRKMFGDEWPLMSPDVWAAAVSPWHALAHALAPTDSLAVAAWPVDRLVALHLLAALGLSAVLNLLAMVKIRDWNPTRDPRPVRLGKRASSSAAQGAPGQDSFTPTVPEPLPRRGHRAVWDYPIAWREVRTWAYGRKIVWVRLAYVALCAGVAWALFARHEAASAVPAAMFVVPLVVGSLLLVNALSVTTITTERDGRALDLLLVTMLSPREIVFGKLGGSLYNTREMVVLPLALAASLAAAGRMSWENATYLAGALVVLDLFVAVLGLHCGMVYANSRLAILSSLGTLFFLLVGVATCVAVLVAFSGPTGPSFEVQLAPFLAFMVGGSAGLYFALGAKSPSPAIGWAALICPFATFWAITSYFLDYTLGIFLVTIATYGFATLAMLVPAVAEFDAIVGRTTGGEV